MLLTEWILNHKGASHIMKYDFLPLIKHSFAYGTKLIMPEFIVSSKAKETLIYPEAFFLLKTSYDYYAEG